MVQKRSRMTEVAKKEMVENDQNPRGFSPQNGLKPRNPETPQIINHWSVYNSVLRAVCSGLSKLQCCAPLVISLQLSHHQLRGKKTQEMDHLKQWNQSWVEHFKLRKSATLKSEHDAWEREKTSKECRNLYLICSWTDGMWDPRQDTDFWYCRPGYHFILPGQGSRLACSQWVPSFEMLYSSVWCSRYRNGFGKRFPGCRPQILPNRPPGKIIHHQNGPQQPFECLKWSGNGQKWPKSHKNCLSGWKSHPQTRSVNYCFTVVTKSSHNWAHWHGKSTS